MSKMDFIPSPVLLLKKSTGWEVGSESLVTMSLFIAILCVVSLLSENDFVIWNLFPDL